MELDSWIKRFFKRQYAKFKINVRKSQLNEIQEELEYRRTCMAICRKLINQKDTQLLVRLS